MTTQIVRARTIAGRRIRLTVSDLLLLFITLNVLVSGVLDWSRGVPIRLPLPRPFGRWHLLSGVVLVVYLAVHVWRRGRRSDSQRCRVATRPRRQAPIRGPISTCDVSLILPGETLPVLR
jgi:hypothetical protein